MGTKFRPHSMGGLVGESMEHIKEFDSKLQLVEFLQNKYDLMPPDTVTMDTLEIIPRGYDDRINWDTHLLHVKGWGVLGYLDGPLV